MKKIIGLTFLAMMLLISSVVLADAAPPALSYDAVISNPDGSATYKYVNIENEWKYITDKKLDYGTTVRFYGYTTVINNEQYAAVGYDDDSCYILFKDIKKKEPWKQSDFHFYDYEHEGTALNANGVSIFEWPSRGEKVIGIIPNKTNIKYKMSWEDGYWGYTTYNGITGWVDLYELGSYNNEAKILVGMKGASILDENNNKVGEIPPATVINGFYEVYRSGNRYVNYNGIFGYISWDGNAYSGNDTKYKYTVNYDNAILIGTDDEIIEIPRGTILEYTYENYYEYKKSDGTYNSSMQIFTNYNGKDGWVFELTTYENEEEKYVNERLGRLMEAIEEAKAFIKNKKKNTSDINEIDSGNTIDIVKQPSEQPIVIEQNTPTLIESKKPTSPMDIIIVCVLFAVAIALTSIIFIIMLNDNSNKKILIILIPATLAIIALCIIMMLGFNSQKTTVQNDIVNNEQLIANEAEQISEKPKEIARLRTSYTKNFFDLTQYGHANYKNDGKQFGYTESYISDDNNSKYNSEVKFKGSVSASSTLAPQGKFSYEVDHVVNGSRSNTWIEGADGFGKGEYVEIIQKNDTSSDRKYREICIVNGYAETMKKWENNSRVKTLKLYHNDEYIATIDLLDTITPQYIDISSLNIVSKANSSDKFKFEIADVYEEMYPGERYSDTAITGIMFGY